MASRGGLSPKAWFILLVVALLLGGGVLFAVQRFTRSDATDRLGTVVRTDLVSQVTVAGEVEPARMTNVFPPYSGYVKKIYVKLGQKVAPGDPVVSIAQSSGAEGGFPLRAPFSGTVGQVLKFEGEYVDPSQSQSNAIVKIYDLSKMFVDANVSEADINKIHAGLAATIRPSGVNARTYRGVIRELFLAAKDKANQGGDSNNLAEFPVKVEITDPDADVKPGMSAVMDIIVGRKDKVLALPHEFVSREKDQWFVTLPKGERREVQVGLQNEELLEIRAGLREGDRVRQVDFKGLPDGP